MAKHRADSTIFNSNREAIEEELLRARFESERAAISVRGVVAVTPARKQWLRNIATTMR
ncbi:hypothetical protein [Curtobacterium sp. USHLN213]|uniref:hypothetical protein n=1 Tax=Curtobacterium sp. USHLN213 TaxID=3081255 RepID=UPI0030175211